MPMHDWTRVEAGIFHAFHHEWISEIHRTLNRGLLPEGYYSLPEQIAAGFGPDVLTLQDRNGPSEPTGRTATLTQPRTKHFAEHPSGLRQRRSSVLAVRHVSDDRIVAMIEIVSPGNKNSAHSFRAFVRKANELMDQGVHLLLLDPFPPGSRDPQGIHAAIWPPNQPLTFVTYESADVQRAYIETLAVGDALPSMPLFLAPEFHVLVPLEATYQSAWEYVPARWQRVIAP